MMAVLGTTDAIARMIKDEIAAWMSITINPLLSCPFASHGKDNIEIKVAKETRDNVVPMNVVPVNHAGLLEKKLIS